MGHRGSISMLPSWYVKLNYSVKIITKYFYNFILYSIGYILQNYARDDIKKLIDKIDKFCTGLWRERIYQVNRVSYRFWQLIKC